MRNRICYLFLLLHLAIGANAQNIRWESDGFELRLALSYVGEGCTDNTGKRTPAKRPTIYIYGNVIIIPENLIGSEVTITLDGVTVFHDVVLTDTIVFNNPIEGYMQIKLEKDSYCYMGECDV